MDIDNKKSSGDSVQKPPTNPIFLTTAEVAKEIGVDRTTVIYWRKQGWFTADHIDNHGVYYYTAERVERLKAVYRRDWETALSGNVASGAEIQERESASNELTTNSKSKKSVPAMFAYVEKQSKWKRQAEPPKSLQINPYFAHQLRADIDALKNYALRKTGFKNID